MFESLTVMHPQLLAQLEALQEQKSMLCHFNLQSLSLRVWQHSDMQPLFIFKAYSGCFD